LYDIILKVLSGKASPEERKRVEEWKAGSDERAQEFRQIARLWKLTALRTPARREHAEALAEILARSARPTEAGHAPPRRSVNRFAWQAAALAACLAAGFLARDLLLKPTHVSRGPIEIVTSAGERASVLLPDGTMLRLGPQSRIRSADLARRREVDLEGEAYFAVAHDPEHPFLIRTAAGEALVLGTRFEMRARDGDLLVSVLEGRVAVTAAGERVVLEAGEVRHARADLPPVPASPEELESVRGQLGSFAAYQDTPLREVAREIEERFELDVRFTDPSLSDRTLTAWFPEADMESMLRVICRVTEVNCTHVDGTLTISR